MTTLFGTFRHSLMLLAVIAAILFTILAGLFLLVAWAVGGLAVGGIGPVSAAVLLLAVIVLLAANFVLLVMLMRCSCRSDRAKHQEMETLLPLLFPMVGQLPNALRDVAIALRRTSEAVGWISENLRNAGEFIDTTVEGAAAYTLTVPTVRGHEEQVGTDLNGNPVMVWKFDGITLDAAYPLSGLKQILDQAGATMRVRTAPGEGLDAASSALRETASVVGFLANGLGASPATPPDVLQP